MRYLSALYFMMMLCHLSGQNTSNFGFEFQIYPTGYLSTINYDHGLSEKSALAFRVGYNNFDHRDLGVHASEIGDGIGGSLGYRFYFKSERKGWNVMLRSDIWFNNVDWADIGVNDIRIVGQTSIIVLQPTASMGYAFLISDHFMIQPSLSFGYEWNVKTTGSPTGQGAILLLGVQGGYRF